MISWLYILNLVSRACRLTCICRGHADFIYNAPGPSASSAPASSSPTPSSPAWAAPGSHLNSHLPRARRLHLHPPWALQLHPQPPELAGFIHSALGSPATSAPTPGSLLHPLIFTCCGHAGSATPTPGPLVHLYLPRARQLHLHPRARRFHLSHKPTVKATMHNQVNISRDLPHLPHLSRASWYGPRDLSEPWRWAGIPRPVTACFSRVLTDCENQWGSSKLPQACLRT